MPVPARVTPAIFPESPEDADECVFEHVGGWLRPTDVMVDLDLTWGRLYVDTWGIDHAWGFGVEYCQMPSHSRPGGIGGDVDLW